MEFLFLGFRQLDFVGNDGKAVKGVQIHASYTEDGVKGQAVDKIFVKADIAIPKGVEIGKPFYVHFNRKGKVVAVSPA
jgi:hypothetical protein